MSEYQILTVFAAFAFAYSLIASRLERTPVNGALVYVAVGILLGPQGLALIDLTVDGEGISRLAELALAVCLFTDSANANLSVLRRIEAIPIRLLLIGLPLTIALGVGVAFLLFGDLSFFEVALIATMLAPTDAALGKAVVTNADVPAKVRESLNVESGLNDGICVPVILLFLALATGSALRRRDGFGLETSARWHSNRAGLGRLTRGWPTGLRPPLANGERCAVRPPGIRVRATGQKMRNLGHASIPVPFP